MVKVNYSADELSELVESSVALELDASVELVDDDVELDDEVVAYCERISAKALSFIFTLAFSSAAAIT